MGRLLVLWLSVSPLAVAQITLDGSLGPAGALAGLDVEIPAAVGRQVGGNLFHSFGRFNVPTGGSAIFTGPGGIDHVVGRVTGGEVSSIDGLLGTRFEGASPDLWLVNPAGVMFGPNAQLDVQGALHVSTADYLRLGNGGRFAADLGGGSVLTSAAPEAFGFLGGMPGAIGVEGGSLAVGEGRDLSLVGGEISIVGGELVAPGGQLSVAAVGSAGEVLPGDGSLELVGFAGLEAISVSAGFLDASADGAGTVVIRGGAVSVEDSGIITYTTDQDGGGIDIRVEELFVRDDSTIGAATLGFGAGGSVVVAADYIEIRNGSAINAPVLGEGDGGSIFFEVGRMLLSGDGSEFVTGVGAQTLLDSGGGRGGDVTVTADHLEIRDGAVISATTFGSGDAGSLSISAGEMLLSGDGRALPTGVDADTFLGSGGGRGGDVTVTADRLEIRNGATIRAATFGSGDAGRLSISAGEMLLSGDGSTLFTGVATQTQLDSGGGRGGDMTVTADHLEIRDGAAISTNTIGSGDAGSLSISAGEMLLSGDSAALFTGVAAQTVLASGGGRGGDVRVTADRLEIRDGARFSNTTFGSGDAGSLWISAEEMFLSHDGAAIPTGVFAQTEADSGGGRGGDVRVTADHLEIRDGAAISTTTDGSGDAGNLSISAGEMLLSGDGSEIPTAVGAQTQLDAGGGRGGDVTVSADRLEIRDGGQISATTTGSGDAGSVWISAGEMFLSRDGAALFTGVGAQTELDTGGGRGGDVRVTADRLEIRNGAEISANTIGSGDAGSVWISAREMLLFRDGAVSSTGIAAETQLISGGGRGGDVRVTADRLEIGGGALISATTFGTGDAGSVSISAREMFLSGDGSAFLTGVTTQTLLDSDGGGGGDVTVVVDRLEIRDGALISARTTGSGDAGSVSVSAGEVFLSGDGSEGFTGLVTQAATDSAGQGGDLLVTADRLEIRDGAQISAATFASGDAGNLVIRVEERLIMDRADIATAAVSDAGGGSITIETPATITLVDSQITTSVAGGDRNAGNITITDPAALVLVDNSTIRANAFGGTGGNVQITTSALLQHPDSVIEASSALGIDGQISIDSPEVDVSTGLFTLSSAFLVDPDLPDPCAVYRPGDASTFTVSSGGLSAGPDGFTTGNYVDVAAGVSTASQYFFLGGGCGSR